MRVLFSLLLLLLPLPTLAQAPENSEVISGLVQDALRNGKGAKVFISEYTHIQTIIRRSRDKKGSFKEDSDTWEAFMPTLRFQKKPQRWVKVKIKENGVALPADKIEKERIQAGEKLFEAEQEAEKKTPKGEAESADDESDPNAKGAYFSLGLRRAFRGLLVLDMKTILSHCEFTAMRRETLNGRTTIALDFKAKANAKLPEAEKYLAHTSGVIWIDETDRILVKAEGWPQTLTSRTGKPAFYYESVLVSGGKWLPHRIFVNGLDYKELFGSLSEQVEAILTDYQRFNTEVKDEKILAPKQPE